MASIQKIFVEQGRGKDKVAVLMVSRSRGFETTAEILRKKVDKGEYRVMNEDTYTKLCGKDDYQGPLQLQLWW